MDFSARQPTGFQERMAGAHADRRAAFGHLTRHFDVGGLALLFQQAHIEGRMGFDPVRSVGATPAASAPSRPCCTVAGASGLPSAAPRRIAPRPRAVLFVYPRLPGSPGRADRFKVQVPCMLASTPSAQVEAENVRHGMPPPVPTLGSRVCSDLSAVDCASPGSARVPTAVPMIGRGRGSAKPLIYALLHPAEPCYLSLTGGTTATGSAIIDMANTYTPATRICRMATGSP